MFWILVLMGPLFMLEGLGAYYPLERAIETRHFVFFFDNHQMGLAQQLASKADRAREKMLSDLGSEQPERIRVVLASTREKMQRMIPEGAHVPTWAGGLAFSRHNMMVLYTSGYQAGANQIEKVFLHELAHLLMDHAVDFRWLPLWFKEGFAIYQSGEWSFQRARTLASGVLSGRLYSLMELEEQFPDRFSDAELAYAQSIDFVSFLLGERGQDAFGRLINLLARGWSFFLAVEESYDQDIDSIEVAWLHDLRVRVTWIPVVTGGATLWLLGSLILVMAYLRKRRKRSRDLQRLAEEESWSEREDPPFGSRGEFLQ